MVLTSLVLAFPMAWLTTRPGVKLRPLLTTLFVMPLAIPGYVVGLSLLSLGSDHGPWQQWTPWQFPRLSGFWGAWIALSLYNFPFMFLNLRSGLLSLDPSMVEASRSLGRGPIQTWLRVQAPMLRPAILSGALIIGLYVLGDFGVVSLMRFETFSYAIFLQYTAAFDRVYAAWLCLMLLVLTLGALGADYWLVGKRASLTSSRTVRSIRSPNKFALFLAALSSALVLLAALAVPLATLFYWVKASTVVWDKLWLGLGHTLMASLPATAIALILAIPLAVLGTRYPSKLSQLGERVAYLGYATPGLALGLGFIFVALALLPSWHQTLQLLVLAYVIHFLGQCIGPIRARLAAAPPKLEEASHALGVGRWQTLKQITLPILRPGLGAAAAFVFLSTIRELPLSILLSPLDYQTLAVRVYGFTAEAMYGEAAQYALLMIAMAFVVVVLLFWRFGEADT